MPSIGNKNPVLSSSQSFPTGSAWTSSSGTSDALAPSDGNYFYTTISSGASSRTLRGTVFGFSSTPVVPLGVTIDGIQIDVTLASSGASSGISDIIVQLLQGDTSSAGDRVGTNKALGTAMPTAGGSSRSYGGSTDLWGTSWTPTSIRSSLGIDLVFAKSGGSSGTIYIDSVVATVWYTLPAIVGTLSLTDALDPLSATAVVRIGATITITDIGDTLSSAAAALVGGGLTLTDANDYLIPPIYAALVVTDAGDLLGAAAQAIVGGALARTDVADLLTGSGAVRIGGALTASDAIDLLTSAAAVYFYVPTPRTARWPDKGARYVTAKVEKLRFARGA